MRRANTKAPIILYLATSMQGITIYNMMPGGLSGGVLPDPPRPTLPSRLHGMPTLAGNCHGAYTECTVTETTGAPVSRGKSGFLGSENLDFPGPPEAPGESPEMPKKPPKALLWSQGAENGPQSHPKAPQNREIETIPSTKTKLLPNLLPSLPFACQS